MIWRDIFPADAAYRIGEPVVLREGPDVTVLPMELWRMKR